MQRNQYNKLRKQLKPIIWLFSFFEIKKPKDEKKE